MQFRSFLVLFQIIIFYNLLGLIFTKPMVGQDIKRADPGQFPGIVAIKRSHNGTTKPENAVVCAGALVTDFHVLTASHCMNNLILNQVEIIVGSVDIRAGKTHTLLWWVDYGKWTERKKIKIKFNTNDIAIFRMKDAAPSNIAPFKISNIHNEEVYGKFVKTAAWGESNQAEMSQFLETADLKVLPNTECEDKIERTTGTKVPIHKRYLCSVGEKLIVLQKGDSGAPVLLDNVIVGVNKATMPFPELTYHPEKINLHVGIASYRKFIQDVITSNSDWR